MRCGMEFGCIFFFFKQKTAYEMRISDWSSDVCSSDLRFRRFERSNPLSLNDFAPVKSWRNQKGSKNNERREKVKVCFQMLFQQLCAHFNVTGIMAVTVTSIVSLANQARSTVHATHWDQIGRASCRERVGQYV